MKDEVWNPWHGCRQYSEGCLNCYVYRRDTAVGIDPRQIRKNKSFNLPVDRYKNGGYKVPSGSSLFVCLTSDFFLEDADGWRPEIWRMIRTRRDVHFSIITKRIERFPDCVPSDWGAGYPNVTILCTVENQRVCERRMPIFTRLPIADKCVVCEPLLGPIDLRPYLSAGVRHVTAGGESGPAARVCKHEWILDLRAQCLAAGVTFWFKQTGARYQKDGRLYRIPRRLQHKQARRSMLSVDAQSIRKA